MTTLYAEPQAAPAEPQHAQAASYVRVWGLLVALLAVSVIGPMFGITLVTLMTAFGVAIVKAYLVAKHFMHLNLEKRYVGYLLLSCLAFVLLFWAGTAPDVMRHEGRNWKNVAAKQHPPESPK
jgi:caa(3)-type oxidase subunit IV